MDALHYFGIWGLRRGFKKDSLVFDVGPQEWGYIYNFQLTFTDIYIHIYNFQFTIYSDIMFQVLGLRRSEEIKVGKDFSLILVRAPNKWWSSRCPDISHWLTSQFIAYFFNLWSNLKYSPGINGEVADAQISHTDSHLNLLHIF